MKRRVFALLVALLPFLKPKSSQAAPSNALVTQCSLQIMWEGGANAVVTQNSLQVMWEGGANAVVTQNSLQVMHDGGLTPSSEGESEMPKAIWFMS